LQTLEEYLTREDRGEYRKAPELCGFTEKDYKKHIVDRNYRIILSPQAGNVPLKTLVVVFMRRLEREMGRKLVWVAANHGNTDHHHAHILINGKDLAGQKVFFKKSQVKTLMRESARDICTALIGHRPVWEIAADSERRLTADRWIGLDEEFKKIAIGDFVSISTEKSRKDRMKKRLKHLESLGLAKKTDKKGKIIIYGRIGKRHCDITGGTIRFYRLKRIY